MAEPNRRRPPRNKKKQGSRAKNFAIFYAITMVIGVVVCVTLFVVAYQTLIPERAFSSERDRPTREERPEILPRPELDQALGLITSMSNSNPRSLTLLLLETGRTQQFNVLDSTDVNNRHAHTIGFSELNLGQIVNVNYNSATHDLSSIALSGRAWEQQHHGGVNIDTDASRITIGNQVYSFSSRTMVLNRGEPFSIALINPDDVLTIVGYHDKIWSVRIDSGHGFIRFENADLVVNGTVAVGNVIFTALEGSNQTLSAPEGVHRIIVNGENIDPWPADVTVRQGETVVVNLSEITPRNGILQLVINVPEASVFINGEVTAMENNQIELQYGTHMLRVESPGFIPVQEEFVLDRALLRRDIELRRDAQVRNVLIETFPSGAQIFVDDALVGNAPITVELEYGQRVITARRAGYYDRSLRPTVDSSSPGQYFLHMEQLMEQIPQPTPTPSPPPLGGDYLPPLPPDWDPVPDPTLPPLDEWPSDPPLHPPIDELLPPDPDELPPPIIDW